jgi:SH3 domain-containing YSC84-like protein 1
MRKGIILTTMLFSAASIATAAPAANEGARLAAAARVVRELREAPDGGIPGSTWARTRCVAVMPGVKKAAFLRTTTYRGGASSFREVLDSDSRLFSGS